MFFFQHPLSDLVVPANDLAFIDMLWRDWSPDLDGDMDAQNCKTSLRAPEHLQAALSYYRCTLGSGPRNQDYDDIQTAGSGELAIPTLYIHGANDGCIGREVAESVRALSPWVHVEIVEGAGHFLQLEKPDVVNSLIIDFLTAD
jgi:pimeloyl-ACP methyl ester carboxylesterase